MLHRMAEVLFVALLLLVLILLRELVVLREQVLRELPLVVLVLLVQAHYQVLRCKQ